MSKLLDLMRKLGSDAALAVEYGIDPDGVMRRAGLSDEERRAMLEKDYDAIKRLTGLKDGQFATNHTVKLCDDDGDDGDDGDDDSDDGDNCDDDGGDNGG